MRKMLLILIIIILLICLNVKEHFNLKDDEKFYYFIHNYAQIHGLPLDVAANKLKRIIDNHKLNKPNMPIYHI